MDDDIDIALDAADEAALDRMRTVAYLLDEGFRVPGTDFRFGIDPLLGVLPGAGDVAAAGLSLYIVVEAANLGVSYSTIVRMLLNIGADAVAGAVPVVGPVFDAFIKANVRNVELVERHLEREAARRERDDAEAIRIEITE
ncbi:DUF4112 domain-containing protein [Halomarina ordinaria]|uniref:DUF4112 domain-containing protein n=1 Tax=Halomarina ordinaria TaxID=3033939 RepID=A0ABD5UDL5_9EURY|nr:DUF4112 domain-containing protein [Halomarina sp. PSRA2]